MAPRIPSRPGGNPKPTGEGGLLALLGTHLFNRIVMEPLSYLLAWVLGDEPDDWDTIEELRDNLVPALIRLPLRILVELIGGIPIVGGAFEDALAGWLKSTNLTANTAKAKVDDTIVKIVEGYTGSTPATSEPAELTVISSSIDSRITALEGGVTEHLIASSQTIDLSMYETVDVLMYGSSAPGGNGGGGDLTFGPRNPGAGSASGGYIFQTYSKGDLEDLLGADLTAVKCVVGANGGKTFFGADSLTVPTVAGSVLSTLAGSNIIGRPEGFDDTLSGAAGGAAGGTGWFRNSGGVSNGTSGNAGQATAIASGGAAGAAGPNNAATSAGGNAGHGNPGSPGQILGRTKCGGSGAGSGGGGGIYFDDGTFTDRYYGRNGGNGAAGGFPGGGSSGGGGAGVAPDGNGTPGVGGPGVNGVMFLRGK